MKKQTSLYQAICKTYGNYYSAVSNNSSQWSQFTPFLNRRNKHIQYFKLIEYSSQYQTSEEVCQKARKLSNGMLHQVTLYQVSRCMNYRNYILRSQSNVMSLRSLCNLKKNSRQELKPLEIINIVEFLALVLKSKSFKGRSINLDSIAYDSFGELKLIDYSIYFIPQQVKEISIRIQIRELLSELLLLVNGYQEATSLVEENYLDRFGKTISLMVYALTECDDDTLVDEAVSSARASLTSDNDTTLTESMIQHNQNNVTDNAHFHNGSFDTSAMTELRANLILKPKKIRNRKIVCLSSIFLFLIIIVGVGLFVYFKHLHSRSVSCQLGEYLDKDNNCMPCAEGCLRCSAGGEYECSVCKESMYLVIKNYDKQVGRCSKDCKGTLIRGNICVEPKIG